MTKAFSLGPQHALAYAILASSRFQRPDMDRHPFYTDLVRPNVCFALNSVHSFRRPVSLLCAMCGRLLVGKSLFHVFAALVGAAMCSAF
jgi:hypothetical protein